MPGPPSFAEFAFEAKHITALRDLIDFAIQALYPEHNEEEHQIAREPVDDTRDVLTCKRCQFLRAAETMPATTDRGPGR